MNEQSIAGILRAGKQSDPRLLGGWVRICEHFARLLQIDNACFCALTFLDRCGVSAADQERAA